jgi:hypothetical protein
MQSGRVNAILKGRKVVKDGDLQKEQDELDQKMGKEAEELITKMTEAA